MTKYKVGDVAALFSKPKSPTTTGGKKLQSLFHDYYSKESKHGFYPQKEKNSDVNKNEDIKEMNDNSASKKSRKRKFSSFNDSELNENVSSKKFKESSEQEGHSRNNISKKQKYRKQKDFLRKNNNLKFNNNVFSNKFEESFKEEDTKSKKMKEIKIQQDSPKKKKQSRENSFNSSSMFPRFEAENDVESSFAQNIEKDNNKNLAKDNKQNKKFIKKSKKKQKLDESKDKLLNSISYKDSDDSDDVSLKKEIKEFIQNNSAKKEMKKNNDCIKKKQKVNLKGQDTMGKPKKNFLENNSPSKDEGPSGHHVKSKKKNRRNNHDQQDFPSTESKADAFNSAKGKSKLNSDDIKQNSLSENLNFLKQDNVKKVKKSKHGLNSTIGNDFLTSENNSEVNISKAKEKVDFPRKSKSKNENGTFEINNFKKSSNKFFDNVDASKMYKNEKSNINNKMQKEQVNKFEVKAPDFNKLPSLDEDNEKNAERLSRTLFVGNLPKNISKQELRNLFTTFGAVESVRLPGIETDKAKIFGENPPKLLHSNYASDTVPGFVVFKDKQSAVEALKLSGSVFKGHHITVDFALPAGTHKIYDDKRSIFIGNLPFDVKDESIWNTFNQCGQIEGVRVVRDRQTGIGKGFGYVLFKTVEAKQNALALETVNVEGREIRIKVVNSNKNVQKSNFSPSKRNTFKSRAIRMKKKVTSGHKSIRKLTNKQKMMHKKKKTAEILQKAMK